MSKTLIVVEDKGFKIDQSKSYLEIFRAVTGCIVSPASFAEIVINCCPDSKLLEETFNDVMKYLQPLRRTDGPAGSKSSD